jgi:hypothetical protein
MAVTATVPYGGLTVPGLRLTVVSAHRRQEAGLDIDWLQYTCEVLMPDGVTTMPGVGWEGVRVDNPDATLVMASPMAQAEEHMLLRLAGIGATEISAGL